MLEVIPLPAFKDNYIWVLQSRIDNSCVVVDPGDALPVLAYLKTQQLQLTAILLTHHHADHCGGVAPLLAAFKVPVYGPVHENIATITQPVMMGDKLVVPGLKSKLAVLAIPGHTAGHVAYYGEGLLFCGDTLFLAGCGRLFEGTAQQMYNSLNLLASLPAETLIYCAHEYTLNNLAFAQTVEPHNIDIKARIAFVQQQRNAGNPSIPATLAIEKSTNPFLRCELPTLKQAAQNFANKKLSTPVEVFQVIREWKDNF